MILFMVKLTYMYLSLHHICQNSKNIENINREISKFEWNAAFENLSVDEKVEFLNKTLLNIFRNYIPNKKNEM